MEKKYTEKIKINWTLSRENKDYNFKCVYVTKENYSFLCLLSSLYLLIYIYMYI